MGSGRGFGPNSRSGDDDDDIFNIAIGSEDPTCLA